MKVLNTIYFYCRGVIGFAKVENDDGSIDYKTAIVPGFHKNIDEQILMNFGTSFPASAGEELFEVCDK